MTRLYVVKMYKGDKFVGIHSAWKDQKRASEICWENNLRTNETGIHYQVFHTTMETYLSLNGKEMAENDIVIG